MHWKIVPSDCVILNFYKRYLQVIRPLDSSSISCIQQKQKVTFKLLELKWKRFKQTAPYQSRLLKIMAPSVKVTVKQGRVIGGSDILPNGRPYYFFKGIPYAEPPVGKLRFQAPVPLKRFATPEIECTIQGNVSFQRNVETGKYIGSEDCLFLNVYTPQIHADGGGLPVMVFIHGGSFINGSGNSNMFKPLGLIQEKVVVVTINYRLGVMGFLSFPEGNIPGNAGLKDQRLALQWVQENISNFGGDPNNVTLFGHSAGSLSVHIHLMSNKSTKLFHKAILQSCLANMKWTQDNNASSKTLDLARKLGCPTTNPAEVAEFLRNYQNLDKMYDPMFESPRWKNQAYRSPVVTKHVIEEDSPEAVFTQSALDSMHVKDSIDIPVIIGCASADGSVLLPEFTGMLEKLQDSLRCFIIDAPGASENLKDLELAIKKFYFKDRNIDKTMLNELNQLITDALFIMPTKEAVELHSRTQRNSSLYFYVFDFEGALNFHKKKYNLENVIKGAAHVDELYYIFQSVLTPERINRREMNVIEGLCKMWTNFAKYGKPTMDNKWRAVKNIEDDEKFSFEPFVISDSMQMGENYLAERVAFWEDLQKSLKKIMKTT